MKKLISVLIVLTMLMAVATAAGAFGFGEVNELQIGENVAEYAPVYYEEYDEYAVMPVMFTWTIPEDGTLTIDFSDDDEATVMCFIIYNNAEAYDIYDKGGSVTIDVVAGASLAMEVYNEEAHIYEAATFHFTVTLGEGVSNVAGTGTEEDPWIVETLPGSLEGNFTEAEADDWEFPGHYYQYTATEDGVLGLDSWYGCMIFVYLNGGDWVDADALELVAGDVVLFNLIPLWAGDYYLNVEFEAGATLEDEVCNHEYMWLEPDYCYEDETMYDLVEMCDCGYIGRRYTPGTEKNPILVDFLYDEETGGMYGTVTVPAGETLWYGQYRIGGMILIVNGVEYGMLEGGSFYDPVVFELTNDTDEDAVYEIVLSWPLGSDYNPDEMPVNSSTELYLPENSYEYVYGWIATEDGELTVTVEGENWLFYFYNYTTYEMTDYAYDCYGNANTVTIQVSAGDEIMLYVGTMTADWEFPEETLIVSTVFVPAGGEGPCTHENLVHVDAKTPSCYEEGNVEHWYCEDCETVWTDEALTMISNHLSVILPATHQNVVHIEAKAPSCYEEGNQEYWYCEDCLTVWVDENLMQISNMKSVVLPATHQHVVHVEAVAPTCTENGNVEYWYCEDCLTVWVDEALLQISNMKNVVDPATGHVYVDGVCSNCGESDQNVPETSDMITVAVAMVAVSALCVVALPKKKEN